MKRWWKITASIDGAVLAISFVFMIWFNNRPDHGVAALTGMGQFVLWYLVFQTALVLALVLAVWALVVYIRKKRRK